VKSDKGKVDKEYEKKVISWWHFVSRLPTDILPNN
jgi:hypothetical protein